MRYSKNSVSLQAAVALSLWVINHGMLRVLEGTSRCRSNILAV